jgi:hypothetical protein
MKMNKLDERQLWLRGQIFKHCLFLMGGLLFFKVLFSAYDVILIDPDWADIFIIVVTMTAGVFEKAFRGGFRRRAFS